MYDFQISNKYNGRVRRLGGLHSRLANANSFDSFAISDEMEGVRESMGEGLSYNLRTIAETPGTSKALEQEYHRGKLEVLYIWYPEADRAEQPLLDEDISNMENATTDHRQANQAGTSASNVAKNTGNQAEAMETETVTVAPADKMTKTRNWQHWYDMLTEYHRTHGHCTVPPSSGSDVASHAQRQLCRWVIYQRELRKTGSLSLERVKMLTLLNCDWSISHADDLWTMAYLDLVDYKSKYGHMNIFASMHDLPENKLAVWVKKQRQDNKNGSLLPDRRQNLEEIGFVWTAPPPSGPKHPPTKMSGAAPVSSPRTRAIATTAATNASIKQNANYMEKFKLHDKRMNFPRPITVNVTSSVSGVTKDVMKQDQERLLLLQQEQERLYQRRDEMNKQSLHVDPEPEPEEQPQPIENRHEELEKQALPKKRQRLDNVVVVDDEFQRDKVDDEVNAAAKISTSTTTSSVWLDEDDVILKELYEAQLHYHRIQAKIDMLKATLASRVQARRRNSEKLLQQKLHQIQTQNEILQQQLHQQTQEQNQLLHQQVVPK
jgi:translation initiation factor IF-1